MFSIKLIIIWAILVAIKPTRKLALALTPWLVFACSYDGMRLLPNYEVNPIDTRGIYEAEKSLFGITNNHCHSTSGTQAAVASPAQMPAMRHMAMRKKGYNCNLPFVFIRR